jgi:hypothetical protein
VHSRPEAAVRGVAALPARRPRQFLEYGLSELISAPVLPVKTGAVRFDDTAVVPAAAVQ